MCTDCSHKTKKLKSKPTGGTSDIALVVKHLPKVFHITGWCRTGEVFTDICRCFATFNSFHAPENGKFLKQELVWVQWIMEDKYFVRQVERMDALK